MWKPLLDRLLRRVVTRGRLSLTWPDGGTDRYGTGTPEIAIALSDPALLRALVLDPELALGEAYMDGDLTIVGDDVRGMLALLADNATGAGYGRFRTLVPAVRKAMRHVTQNNTRAKSRRNVEVHYDLSVELYQLFLDDDLQYTCGYYPEHGPNPGISIEDAQIAKKAHIARKLLIEPDMRVLDIGCGWGGTSITLARDYGACVTGVTLSTAQLDHARKRAEAAGVADRIDFRLMDYRDLSETFDRIVVIGMMEHVGQPQYATFFDTIHRSLAPDGIALVHTIGRASPPGLAAPWIDRYIFPGAYVPAMSEVMKEVERNRLIACDIEVWRMHYVDTLRAWQAKFETNVDTIRAMYDDRFIRMWRYYLISAEIGFTHLGNAVFQFQLSRQQMAVPRIRDYLYTGRDDR